MACCGFAVGADLHRSLHDYQPRSHHYLASSHPRRGGRHRVLNSTNAQYVVSGANFSMNFLLLAIQSAVCVLAVWGVKRAGFITCKQTSETRADDQSVTGTSRMPSSGGQCLVFLLLSSTLVPSLW